MSLATNYEEFKREVELIIKQNPLECELYSIVAAIVREAVCAGKSISLRDVTLLRKQSNNTNAEDRKYKTKDGLYGTVDFLLIHREYTYFSRKTNNILGGIEVKALHESLDRFTRQKSGLFVGAVTTFKSMIYTNGLKWKLYKYQPNEEDKYKLEWAVELGQYCEEDGLLKSKNAVISDKDIVKWKDASEWDNLLCKLREINWCSNSR